MIEKPWFGKGRVTGGPSGTFWNRFINHPHCNFFVIWHWKNRQSPTTYYTVYMTKSSSNSMWTGSRSIDRLLGVFLIPHLVSKKLLEAAGVLSSSYEVGRWSVRILTWWLPGADLLLLWIWHAYYFPDGWLSMYDPVISEGDDSYNTLFFNAIVAGIGVLLACCTDIV